MLEITRAEDHKLLPLLCPHSFTPRHRRPLEPIKTSAHSTRTQHFSLENYCVQARAVDKRRP